VTSEFIDLFLAGWYYRHICNLPWHGIFYLQFTWRWWRHDKDYI